MTVRIRWYPARPEDGTLPFTSRICSLDWCTRPEEAEGVGEVWGESRNFNRKKPIPGPVRNHVCGHRFDHQFGGVYDPSRPPMRYLPSGLPVCCEPGRHEGPVSVSVTPLSLVIRDKVYRSTLFIDGEPRSRLIRHQLNRSTVCVCPTAIESTTSRVDPYHADVLLVAVPLATATTTGVYHSEVIVAVDPESEVIPDGSTECPVFTPSCFPIASGFLNERCPYEIKSPVALNGWRRWSVVPGEDYVMQLEWSPEALGGTGTWQVYQGSGCEDMEFIQGGAASEFTAVIPFTADSPYVYLFVSALLPPVGVIIFLCELRDAP